MTRKAMEHTKPIDPNTGITLNQLAREQMKLRLMQDIRMDITVCQQEGIDYKPYLSELKQIIDGFLGV